MAAPWETQSASTAPWEIKRPNLVQRVGQWLTAENREPEIPLAYQSGLQLSLGDATKMTALLATTASDDRLRSGIQKILPDAQFETDQFGNLVVVTPVTGSAETSKQWTRFYPNPRGLDMTDIMQGAGAISAGEALALGGGALLGSGGLLAPAAIGATEAGAVELASSKLSGDQYKWGDIPWGAAGGVLGAKIQQLAGSVARKLGFGGQEIRIYDNDGNLTNEGKALVNELGIDPSEMTREMASYIEDSVNRSLQPGQSAVMGEAQTLPVPVPLSRGQVTGDPAQQLFEDMAAKGAYGNTASSIMQGLQARQQLALQQNIPAIQRQIGGTPDILEQRAGAARAQETLARMREAERAAASAQYGVAKTAGNASFISKEAAADAADLMRGSVRDFNVGQIPVVNSILDDIDEIMTAGGDIVSLFQKRSELVSAQGGIPQEAAAARAAKNALDSVLDNAVENQLLRGTPEMVDEWSRAIRGWAEYKGRWEDDGILKKLTGEGRRDGEILLTVDPNDAARIIIGATPAGLISKIGIARDLRVMHRELPAEDWNALRQEAFMTIMEKAQQNVKEVSGGTLYSYWNTLKRRNPELVRTLFTADEQALISQYASVAGRIAGTERNFSNSAAAAGGILINLFSAFGKTRMAQSAAQAAIASMLNRMSGAGRAASAASPDVGALIGMLPGVSAGVGAAAITSDQPAEAIGQQIERTTGFQVR